MIKNERKPTFCEELRVLRDERVIKGTLHGVPEPPLCGCHPQLGQKGFDRLFNVGVVISEFLSRETLQRRRISLAAEIVFGHFESKTVLIKIFFRN